MAERLVFLVPGFFGFEALGELRYFHRVEQALEQSLRRRGCEARIVTCPTQPTGSIPRRADRLRRRVLESGGLEAEELYFVGHSTGGLDVRLLLTPGVRLAEDESEERIASLTRAAVTVATPHHGTPLASFLTTVQGRSLLVLLAALATSREGRGTLYLASQALGLLARLGDVLGRRRGALDQLSHQVLSRVRFQEDDPIWEYLREIGSDQGAILQLTPEAMHLFNAAVSDRPGVSYTCVATAAPRPPAGYGLRDLPPQRAALRLVFVLLYGLAARPHRHYPYPEPDPELHALLESELPFPIGVRSNDGIVPTRSQLRGALLRAVLADHLDVVGQYHRPGEPLSDWLPSGARFDPRRFERVWDAIGAEIARAGGPRAADRSAPAASLRSRPRR